MTAISVIHSGLCFFFSCAGMYDRPVCHTIGFASTQAPRGRHDFELGSTEAPAGHHDFGLYLGGGTQQGTAIRTLAPTCSTFLVGMHYGKIWHMPSFLARRNSRQLDVLIRSLDKSYYFMIFVFSSNLVFPFKTSISQRRYHIELSLRAHMGRDTQGFWELSRRVYMGLDTEKFWQLSWRVCMCRDTEGFVNTSN